MYTVSQAYQTAESRAVKQFKIKGKCCGKDYTDADILQGSFTVSNQCSSPSELTLGAVYVGQLSATFINSLDITRNAWAGGTITVSVGLKLANGHYEYIPMGTYTIAEAKHARSGVEVVAYDNMSLFDKSITFDTSYGTVYELLTAFCLECGVTLGMTEEEVEALPNGTRTLGIYQDNDCETYRDLLSYLAAVCGCFATMDRSGHLVLRLFTGESVDTFDNTERFSGCKFSDYKTSYAGVKVTNAEAGGIDVYTNANRGVLLDLGQNPFMQYGLGETLEEIGNEIAAAIEDIVYTPFEATVLCGAEFDLGDVLIMTAGTAGAESTCIIQSLTWTFGKGCSIKGVGSNPDVGSARSKYDKAISGMRKTDANEIKYYTFTNASPYELADGDSLMIMYINFATVKAGYVVFQCEIHAEVSGEITFKYKLNSADLDFVPIEQFTVSKDNHIISLFYPFTSQNNMSYELELYAEMSGGTCSIAARDIRALLWGQGLAASDTWTGVLHLEDEFEGIVLEDIVLTAVADTLALDADSPTTETFADTFGTIRLSDIEFLKNFRAAVYFNRDPAIFYTWDGFGEECSDWDDAKARFDW